jgi:MinD superfamily P-loop ATPase
VKELVILSGKGGTGKTTIAGAFAVLAGNKVLVDCDVDASNLHLLLQPEIQQRQPFQSGDYAEIDPDMCTQCGLCRELCRFDAIHDFRVSADYCEGCGFCVHVCPEAAITLRPKQSGQWFRSVSRYGPLLHAELGVACENSGQLVALLRQEARRLAGDTGADYIISDGPPGTACPAISALSGVDLALLVTEPTVSGNHDLTRVLDLCAHFRVPAAVCINKWDINPAMAGSIRQLCQRYGVSVISEIAYDENASAAIRCGQPLGVFDAPAISAQAKDLYQKTMAMLMN